MDYELSRIMCSFYVLYACGIIFASYNSSDLLSYVPLHLQAQMHGSVEDYEGTHVSSLPHKKVAVHLIINMQSIIRCVIGHATNGIISLAHIMLKNVNSIYG